ncbi:MAG: NifU family protein [bacterium]|nr:NifU family protein [bacterium]MCY4164187.1 NifU family protein [bacterium]MCY4257680.1 NifU family protein [bacterium]
MSETVQAQLFEVTEAAIAKVLEIRSSEDNPEELGLRIEITGVSGADYTYDLAFEEIAACSEGHRHIVTEGLAIMIPEDSVTNLSGATLDLPNNPMQGGLVIRNPNKPDLLAGANLELSGTLPEQLQQLLDQHINPSLASHGGFAALKGVDGATAYITMGGGCQGCAMSAATLREGITVMITEAIPEITDVVDVTDHEAGDNPYFSRT